MLKRRRNARCTAIGDSVLMNLRTQKKKLVLHSKRQVHRLREDWCTGRPSTGVIIPDAV